MNWKSNLVKTGLWKWTLFIYAHESSMEGYVIYASTCRCWPMSVLVFFLSPLHSLTPIFLQESSWWGKDCFVLFPKALDCPFRDSRDVENTRRTASGKEREKKMNGCNTTHLFLDVILPSSVSQGYHWQKVRNKHGCVLSICEITNEKQIDNGFWEIITDYNESWAHLAAHCMF